jgi:hypothetical protein
VANVVIVVLLVLLVGSLVYRLRYHGTGIVARRGLSIGADLAGLGDAPRVRVITVSQVGPDRVRVVLAPDSAASAGPEPPGVSDLDVVVQLDEDEFGFGLLQEWRDSESWLGLVIPPGSRLLRLRSIDDLQHLTLRRIDQN